MVYIKMAMISVEVLCSDNHWNVTRLKEIQKWCSKSFGKNQRGKPQIWKSRAFRNVSWDESGYRWNYQYYYKFYFSNEQQANWFRLKWL